MDESGVDFAFVATSEDGNWVVTQVLPPAADSLDELISCARQRQGQSGALAFVSVADEFFVAIRLQGSRTRVLLSDANAIFDWPIAEDAAELLGLEIDDDEELPDVEPAGDLKLFADLGLSAPDLDLLCTDPELYPSEQIGAISAKLGFGEDFSDLSRAMSA
ncbi:MAG: tRNA adenosine deaminase-associated protein [Candidatus Nanopelagicales bacterium]|nr:tRNA adenosine deaminase-associated protein [Candidatus Nanopelagicales bacterium]